MTLTDNLPVFRWGKWPEHLLTKLQMDEAGYQTGKKLPPPAAKVSREKSPGGWMLLYDKNAGVPKRQLSEEVRAAAQERAKKQRARWFCPHCGDRVRRMDSWCERCNDKASAIEEAKAILALPEFYVLDTETTGLGDAEIIEIAIIRHDGAVMLSTRVKPTQMEGWEEATAIHGITPAMLADEHIPTWAEVWPKVEPYLLKTVIIFNAEFDMRMLRSTCRHNEMTLSWGRFGDWRCLMTLDAQHYGEWSHYHKSYKWQRLEGGDHSALGDARAALSLLKHIAADATFEEQVKA